MALMQTSLGIATLLSQVWIPLAALHQAGALVLVALMAAFLTALYNQPVVDSSEKPATV
jgi:Cytochrome oxidase assembly protein.